MESKQSDLIKTALEGVRGLIDANTVTGTPIHTEAGTIIIPVSKVFVGLATGGIDFLDKKGLSDKKNFGGGGGTGVTVSPVGFLVIDKDGKVNLLNINAEPKDLISNIFDFIEGTPELIERFKKIFFKNEEKIEE
jgi:sporulation protein YtfJ